MRRSMTEVRDAVAEILDNMSLEHLIADNPAQPEADLLRQKVAS